MARLLALPVLPLILAAPALALEEVPALAARVHAGALPVVGERLPETPRRDVPSRQDWTPGRYGGTLKTLARGGRDARDLVVLGYARLVAWNESYRLVPDILAGFEAEAGRIFTLRLRPGHRWSDGEPFTAEDFRFWWEDVANHPTLSLAGPPRALIAGGQPPAFEVLDETTLRFSWPVPNPHFLPALAGTSPPFIYRPAHALKRFHARYAERAALEAEAEALGLDGWAALYWRQDRPFAFDNPALPTLQPWVNTSTPPAERFLAERNPYFHRVDPEGRQLPYIDRVVLVRTQARLIPAQAAAGESGLQAKGLALGDFTLLKEAEARNGIQVRLWPIGRGAQLALYPNLNAADPVWRALLRQVDFRRALSLAIDRDEINRALYRGLALPGADSLLPASPLYRPAYRAAWARYDPAEAKRLLDRLGLARQEPDGVRSLPDGRPLSIVVETGATDPAEVDLLELIEATWREAGVELLIRSTGRQAFRQRVQSGETVMSLFYGLANGLATRDSSPAELAPTSEKQNNWPSWGLFYQSGGKAGSAPDLPSALRLLELYEAWARAETAAGREAAWREMLALHGEQVLTIGIVGGVLQPVVADRRLRNLPNEAPYLYEPGAYFGVTRPDTYWFED